MDDLEAHACDLFWAGSDDESQGEAASAFIDVLDGLDDIVLTDDEGGDHLSGFEVVEDSGFSLDFRGDSVVDHFAFWLHLRRRSSGFEAALA